MRRHLTISRLHNWRKSNELARAFEANGFLSAATIRHYVGRAAYRGTLPGPIARRQEHTDAPA